MQDSLKHRKNTAKKATNLIKDENGEIILAIKSEGGNSGIYPAPLFKSEGDVEIIESIDYEKDMVPDFTKVPEEIIKNEMQKNGFKTCQVKKSLMFQLLGEIWNYRKIGKIPDEYSNDD